MRLWCRRVYDDAYNVYDDDYNEYDDDDDYSEYDDMLIWMRSSDADTDTKSVVHSVY